MDHQALPALAAGRRGFASVHVNDLTCPEAPAEALALDGELTIVQATALRERLLEWLPQADGRLDLSGISACDSAGIQLLLALSRSLRESGRTLQILQPSTAVVESLQRYGLDALRA
ncbi:STAS domain-containing protein [Sphaerotilus sulfidivorans]|uniref:STAS domain-containing protein n=1 Tax=Sphaerotilus sulfidivorans TaxID=639200 RepID=A0A5C1Q527_9BURK|nr:STAS domain-containing protein [Sphaerotilus sulfidivorans]